MAADQALEIIHIAGEDHGPAGEEGCRGRMRLLVNLGHLVNGCQRIAPVVLNGDGLVIGRS